jgi:hypothetical protein
MQKQPMLGWQLLRSENDTAVAMGLLLSCFFGVNTPTLSPNGLQFLSIRYYHLLIATHKPPHFYMCVSFIPKI